MKLENALQALNQVAPVPWSVKGDDLSSYIYDANGRVICGGENSEGRVDYSDPWVEPLIELTKALCDMEVSE